MGYITKKIICNAATLGHATFDERAEELDKALTIMETSGLQVNIQKSKWAVTQATCLGHVASTNGRSPDPKKTQGLVSMKDPKNKRQV